MRWLPLLAVAVATPAVAQDARDYCPERPGIDTPACIMSPGRVSVEASFADWTLDRGPGARTDQVLAGDTLVRVGVTPTLEARVGWTAFGHVREREGGRVKVADRVGDVTLGLKYSLAHPGGDDFSVAVLPFASLPVGRAPVGAGDWGAGLVIPATLDLSPRWQFDVTPEVDAAVDADGHGRHLAYSLAMGIGWKATDRLFATAEVQAARDDDPTGAATTAIAALSFGWMIDDDTQIDVFEGVGLKRAADDARFYVGVARRF